MLKHKIKNVISALLTCMIIIGMTVSATETAPVFIDESLMAELEEHVARQNASLSKSEIKTLAQELYQEKYIDEPSVSSAEEQADFVDIAYENMLKRENYIVELISSHSGDPTSRDAWEFNLTYLKQHYDEITTLDNINLQYIDSYIEDYEILLHTQDMPESRINIAYRGSYSVTKAVEYAEKYYQNYNSAYPNWGESYGGDCANFISQHKSGTNYVIGLLPKR